MKIVPCHPVDPFEKGPDPDKFEVTVVTHPPTRTDNPALSVGALYQLRGSCADFSYARCEGGFSIVLDESSNYYRIGLLKLEKSLAAMRKYKRAPRLKAKSRGFANASDHLRVESSGVGQFFDYLDIWIDAYNPDIVRSPLIEVFYEVQKRHGYMGENGGFTPKSSYSKEYPLAKEVDHFNLMLEDLYKSLRSDRVAALIKARLRRANDEMKSLREYIDLKVAQYPTFTVVKVSLSYSKDDPEAVWSSRSVRGIDQRPLIKVFQSDMKKFFNNLRSRNASKKICGHIRWIDFGAQRGPFASIIFLVLDSSKCEVNELIEQVGDVWDDVTNGHGVFVLKKEQFASCALNKYNGVVTHDNFSSIDGLYLELKIQAAISLHFMPNFGCRFERFSRSEYPGAKAELAARRKGMSFFVEFREAATVKERSGVIRDDSVLNLVELEVKSQAIKRLRDDSMGWLDRLSRKRKSKAKKSKPSPYDQNMNASAMRTLLSTRASRKIQGQVEMDASVRLDSTEVVAAATTMTPDAVAGAGFEAADVKAPAVSQETVAIVDPNHVELEAKGEVAVSPPASNSSVSSVKRVKTVEVQVKKTGIYAVRRDPHSGHTQPKDSEVSNSTVGQSPIGRSTNGIVKREKVVEIQLKKTRTYVRRVDEEKPGVA